MKNCLTIAGSDPSGGAGIQADLKTFSANGVFGMSIITSVVAENTSVVISSANVPNNIINDQFDAVFTDITVDGVKVGMLANEAVMNTVAKKLKEYSPAYTVIDPVMIAKGGCALMKEDALSTLIEKIIPLAFILTPNIPEAQAILGRKITTIEEMKAAAADIYKLGAKNVLIKGGHLNDNPTDILFNGKDFFTYAQKRIKTKNTHGTGCTLSSAITANLAKGKNVETAIKVAKDYVTQAITHSLEIGKGNGPTNHFYEYYNMKGIK